MRLGVVGSRDFVNLDAVKEYIVDLHPDSVVSGGARGVDRTAEETARNFLSVPVRSFRPAGPTPFSVVRWDLTDHGTSQCILPGTYPSFAAAAFVRNGFIVEVADEVVAFWDGHSRGTKDSIAKAREAGKLRDIIRG